MRANRRLKVDRSLKPAANAIAETLSAVQRRRTAARVKARMQDVLVRRHPNDRAEGPQEMIRAHRRNAGEAGERKRLVRVTFDPMQRRTDPPLVGSA
jgi:hypothetical protein